MSHIVKGGSPKAIGRKHCAVKVQIKDKNLYLVEDGFCIVTPDTLILPLPSDIKVYSEDGEEIPASGKFYVSAETINPYHLVIDIA